MSAALHCHSNFISQQLSQLESLPSTSPITCRCALLLSYPSPLSGRLLRLDVTFPVSKLLIFTSSQLISQGSGGGC